MDGKTLAAATSLGMYLYDSLTLELKAFYPTGASVTAVQFSPDRETYAWGFDTGLIEIRQIEDGRIIQTLRNSPKIVLDLAYSQDGSQLATIQDNTIDYLDEGTSYLWRLPEGQLISQYTLSYHSVYELSDNGQVLGNAKDRIEILDVNSWQLKNSIAYVSLLYAFAISPNGDKLIFEDANKVAIWQAEKPDDLVVLADIPPYQNIFFADSCQIEADGPGFGSVDSAGFSPDGKLMVLGLRTGTIQVRRVSDGSILSSVTGFASKIVFAPDNQTFAVLPGDGTLEIHKVDGTLIEKLTGHTNGYSSVDISPDGRYVAAGASDALVRIWRTAGGERALDLQVQARRVVFSPDGKYLATGSNNGGVMVWNLLNGDQLVLEEYRFARYGIYSINSLLFTPDGGTLIAGSQACYSRVWNIESGQIEWTVTNGPNEYGSSSPVKSMTLTNDGQIAATTQFESVFLFNLVTQEVLPPILIDYYWEMRAVSIIPNTSRIAVGEWNRFQVWEIESAKKVYGVDGPSFNLVSSPNGELLATTDLSGAIYLWRAEDGQLLAKLEGHRDEVTQLAFSPDGKYLASASQDGTVRLWGVQQAQP